jgi:hypothetical protein
MLRISVCLAVLLVAGSLHTASAQTTTAPPATTAAPADAKPSKMKLTVQKLKDMQAQARGLSQRGEIEGTGRRRSLVLHRRLHGQDLSFGTRQMGLEAEAACPLNHYLCNNILLGIWHARH